MLQKLFDFAKKVNKWYVWLVVCVVIICFFVLNILGFSGCQSVKVYSDSSSVSVDGDFDLQPQTAVETNLNRQYGSSVD